MSFKWWVAIAASLFISATVAGALTPENLTWPSALINNLKEFSRTLQPYHFSTAMAIFTRNLTSLVMSFLFSPLLCLVPLLALTLNGWMVGFVSFSVLKQFSLTYVLAGILPHGLFELPAIILGEAAALKFGSALILALFKQGRRATLKIEIQRSLAFLGLAGALLVPAAMIETFVTPMLLGG